MPRSAITNEQRQAIRVKAASRELQYQKDLIPWFLDKYKRKLTPGQITECLSSKYSFLDDTILTRATKQVARTRELQYPALDVALHEWQLRIQGKKGCLTGDIIRAAARRIWEQLPQYAGKQPPKLSDGWLHSFKARYNVKLRTQHGDAGSVNPAEHVVDMDRLRGVVSQYAAADTYNIDETGLCWKASPNRTLSSVQQAGRKYGKERITIVNCVNADGTHRLPLWFIGKAKSPRCFRGVNLQAWTCVWESNKTAWMRTDVFERWLRWFDQQVAGKRVLLLMDNFSAHLAVTEAITRGDSAPLRHVNIEYLPPNTTSLYQPLDQGIIANFKVYYRKRWVEYMIEEYEADRDPLKTINVLKAVRWSMAAWEQVTSTTIANCGRKSSLHGEAYGPLNRAQADVAAEQLQLLQSLQDSMNEAVPERDSRMAIDRFLNLPEEMIFDSDQEDIELVIQLHSAQEAGADVESDEEEEILPKVTVLQALNALRQLRLHEEQQDDPNNSISTILTKHEGVLQQRRRGQATQRPIESFFTT